MILQDYDRYLVGNFVEGMAYPHSTFCFVHHLKGSPLSAFEYC